MTNLLEQAREKAREWISRSLVYVQSGGDSTKFLGPRGSLRLSALMDALRRNRVCKLRNDCTERLTTMTTRKIEIDFALPVELTDDEMRHLCDFVQKIAKRHQPEGMVHWQSGCGSKPIFSQADARFLGKPVDPNAPERGEPEFDDEIFHIETCAREAYPGER